MYVGCRHRKRDAYTVRQFSGQSSGPSAAFPFSTVQCLDEVRRSSKLRSYSRTSFLADPPEPQGLCPLTVLYLLLSVLPSAYAEEPLVSLAISFVPLCFYSLFLLLILTHTCSFNNSRLSGTLPRFLKVDKILKNQLTRSLKRKVHLAHLLVNFSQNNQNFSYDL